MNIIRRYRLSKDPSLTVSNLLDELLSRRGDGETSVGDFGVFRLSELHRDVCSIDAFLRRSIGLKPGQAVAVYRTNDRNCFHWFLAIVRAGGIAMPLNPMLSLPEVRRIIEKSGIDILVTDRAVFERTIHTQESLHVKTWIQVENELAPPVQQMDGFIQRTDEGEFFSPTGIDPKETIAVFHTSGTSGFPKGAALSSNALLGGRSSTVLASFFLGSKDLALIALPWSHIMGISIALNGLVAGIRGCLLDRFDVERALETIERFGITAVVGVPEMFTRIVNSNPDPSRLKTVRLWLSASDHLPTDVRARLRQFGGLIRFPFGRRIPPVLLNGYGMVELGGLAMMGVDLSFMPGSGDFCFPVPPFRIRIVDDGGREVKSGQVGELQIRRGGMRPHYWKDKGDSQGLLTADGYIRTGDLATRNRLRFIRLVGRSKDVIKSGGYSIYVRELEEAVSAHPQVSRAAAFGLPHKEKGEIAVAVVELHEGASVSETELVEWCRQSLAAYKAPRRIWVLEAGTMPQNHNGKTLRRELRERFTVEINQG
jgi:acyl-CoA synthetase (AMP-forming)/AMP-acid ligase II